MRRSAFSPPYWFVAAWLFPALLAMACSTEPGADLVLGQTSYGLNDPTARFASAASGNFSYGERSDEDIEYIVVHTMQGYYSGSISWFQNPSSKVSAHYLVRSSDGEITQMVDVSDLAYHDACFNSQSIGIEHEGFIAESEVWYTDAMYESSARLSAWLAETYGIPLDREHILGHGETDDCSDHTDPGPDWDWDKYMTLIREAAEPTLDAQLVDFDVPATAAPNTQVDVWFELENLSSDVFDDVRTRLVTSEPAERESLLFVAEAWESSSVVSAPDAVVEPGQRVRFAFPIRIPQAPDGTLLSEAFQLSHEGKVFGPLLRVELVVQAAKGIDEGEDSGATAEPTEADAGAEPPEGPGAAEPGQVSAGAEASGGCSLAGGSQSQPPGLLGLLVAIGCFLRRRRHRVRAHLAVILLSGCASGVTSPAVDAACSACDAASQTSPATAEGGVVSSTDAGAMDLPADAGDTAVEVDLVDVSHRREMRGVWVASVGNINFPSKGGLSADAQKAEIDRIVDTCKQHGMNAIFFQVRPEADALYASDLEPWSRFLTGTQGVDPGYDPLAYIIERAHAQGIELHAWLNPYRAASNASVSTAATHVSKTMPSKVVKYGSLLWMDPGAKAVQDHTSAVVSDIVERYAVDGIHFDDYFYPYPDGTAFPDASSYAAARAEDSSLTLGDFRRAAVNALVERVAKDIRAIRPEVLFGISPFGIYRPGMPEGITGLDQYAEIYSDPLKWVEEEWVDYIAPQLYWPTTQKAQAYEPLLDYWSERAQGHCLMFAGNNLSNLGKTGWDLAEMRTQIELGRESSRQTQGNIFFTLAPVMENKLGVATLFKDELYAAPALPPVAVRLDASPRPEPPKHTLTGHTLRWTTQATLRGYVLYRQQGDVWTVTRQLTTAEDALLLDAGTWALTAVGPNGKESQGVRLVVP